MRHSGVDCDRCGHWGSETEGEKRRALLLAYDAITPPLSISALVNLTWPWKQVM